MSHSAQGVGLAGAGQSEGQHVDAAVYEATAGQLVQLLPERQGHPVVLEGLPSLARGQPGCGAQPGDAPLPAVLGLLLQHLQEGLQGVAVAGGSEAGHRLLTHGGQPELVAQLPDPVVDRLWCPSSGHLRQQGVIDPQVRGTPGRLSAGACNGVGLASSLTAA